MSVWFLFLPGTPVCWTAWKTTLATQNIQDYRHNFQNQVYEYGTRLCVVVPQSGLLGFHPAGGKALQSMFGDGTGQRQAEYQTHRQRQVGTERTPDLQHCSSHQHQAWVSQTHTEWCTVPLRFHDKFSNYVTLKTSEYLSVTL